jgi:glutamate 5-kinase
VKVVIKVGTQALMGANGLIDESILQSLVDQIVQLQQQGHPIVLVTSGAVGTGRMVARELLGREYGATIAEKQVLASLGQHELLHLYAKMFKVHKTLVSQLLLTKQDFHTRKHYLNISRILHEILDQKNIIPIVNENDTVAVEELMFTDNDELSGLIAAQINASCYIILTNVAGVYDAHPDDPNAKVIPVIDLNNKNWPSAAPITSTHGRGGMANKLATARKMSNLGITTYIASIHEKNPITRIIAGESIGTKIIPNKKKSSIKRWIAFDTSKQHGSVSINDCLYDILKENKRVLSLLPVGITEVNGQFKKGDLVDIIAHNHVKIGVGIARYDSEKLREYLGKKGMPEFIHYDHLHIQIEDE